MPMQELESFYNIDINKGVLINSVDRIGPTPTRAVNAQDILAGRQWQADQRAISRRNGRRCGTRWQAPDRQRRAN